MKLNQNFPRGGRLNQKTIHMDDMDIFLEHDEKTVVHVYTFTPYHKKSEYGKAIVYLMIPHPIFLTFAMHMSHGLCLSLYFLKHGIKTRVYTKKYK